MILKFVAKRQIELKVGKDKTINVLIDKRAREQKVAEMIRKGAGVAFDYFNNVKKINFGVELIYSRAEFDEKIGFKTENWVTAHSFGNRFIIFSPAKIEKQTSHKKNEFIPIVSHETSHVLLKKLNTDFCTWLNEGIAQNIARQEQEKEIGSENIEHFLRYSLFKNSNYHKFISKQGYEISYKLTRFLMASYSKKQMMELLKIKYCSIKSPEKDFCKILKTDKEKLIEKFKEVLKRP